MSRVVIGVTQFPPNGVYCRASYGEMQAVTSDFPVLVPTQMGPVRGNYRCLGRSRDILSFRRNFLFTPLVYRLLECCTGQVVHLGQQP
jgi:hypothetical protein